MRCRAVPYQVDITLKRVCMAIGVVYISVSVLCTSVLVEQRQRYGLPRCSLGVSFTRACMAIRVVYISVAVIYTTNGAVVEQRQRYASPCCSLGVTLARACVWKVGW